MTLHAQQRELLFLVLLMGPMVLISYWLGITGYPDIVQELWGDIPESVRGPYTANMFVAATGFFLFLHHLLRHVDPTSVRVLNRFGYRFFTVCMGLILVFSTVWMPLSLHALDHGRADLLLPIEIVLWLVAIGSLGIAIGVAKLERSPTWSWRLALLGSLMFCSQTVVLDGLIWPRFFHL